MFIDTHCHPILQKDKTIPEILENFQKTGGKYMISIGTNVGSSHQSVDFAKNQDYTFSTIGIHPCDIENEPGYLESKIQILEQIYQENKHTIVGIGETGLDYYRLHEEHADQQKILQKKYFIAHIQLAKKYDLPLIIHNRDAGEDILQILIEHKCENFIIHCFSEDLEYAQKCINISQKCKISFSGIVTFKNATKIQETAKKIPLKHILIETDSPYLTPSPFRGKQENEPAFTQYVLDEIINLRDESPQEIKSQIFKNSLEIYGLDEYKKRLSSL